MDKPRLIKFEEGSIVLREGEINSDMFKIIQGHAELYTAHGTEKESLLGIIGPQACFGEFGILLSKPSIYTVVAYSELVVMRVGEEELAGFVSENQKNIIDIMKNMAGSMMTMRKQIDLLIDDLEAVGKTQRINITDRKLQSRQLLKQYAMFSASKP